VKIAAISCQYESVNHGHTGKKSTVSKQHVTIISIEEEVSNA